MYRIIRVDIQNFKNEKDVSLIFVRQNLTIIHGINGVGKTTLLKVLHGMFKLDDVILENENIYSATMYLEEIETGIKIYLRASLNEDGSYDWESNCDDTALILERNTSLVFGVNRGISDSDQVININQGDISRMFKQFNLPMPLRTNDQIGQRKNDQIIKNRFFDEIAVYLNRQALNRKRRLNMFRHNIDLDEMHLMIDSLSMEYVEALLRERYMMEKKEIADKVQNALFETLAQIIDEEEPQQNMVLSPSDFMNKVYEYKDTLLDILIEINKNKLSEQIIMKLETLDFDNQESFFNNSRINSLIYNMILELEGGKSGLNSLNRLIDEFNKHLGFEKKLCISSSGVYIETPFNNHGIEKLSSGEKHLLSFLTIFCIEGSKRSFIMIDEPEISLNLEWQSKLLDILTQFAPNSQIIIATHSPSIASYDTSAIVKMELVSLNGFR